MTTEKMQSFDVNRILIDAGFRYEAGSDGIWDRGGYRAIVPGRDGKVGEINLFAFGENIGRFRDFEDFKKAIEQTPGGEAKQPESATKTTETIVSNAKLDYELDFPEPKPLLQINGTTAGTPEGIATFTGQKKARKTFAITLLLADVIKAIWAECSATPRQVIWADTEQARHHVVKIANRLAGLTGLKKSQMKRFLSIYCLREYEPYERRKAIAKAAENIPEHSYIIIDGIRDLLNDFNDPTESNELVTWLMQLASEKQILIITVLHQNKGNAMARGHLGTELGNKSESLINVTVSDKNDEVSIIEAEATRNPPFQPQAFFIDADGLPQKTDIPAAKVDTREITPSGIPDNVHINVISLIFSTIKEYNARQMFEAVANGLTDAGVKIGTSKARQFVTYYEQKEWIQNTSGRPDRKKYVIGENCFIQK